MSKFRLRGVKKQRCPRHCNKKIEAHYSQYRSYRGACQARLLWKARACLTEVKAAPVGSHAYLMRVEGEGERARVRVS